MLASLVVIGRNQVVPKETSPGDKLTIVEKEREGNTNSLTAPKRTHSHRSKGETGGVTWRMCVDSSLKPLLIR